MSDHHKTLVEQAEDKIQDVFGDRSVSAEKTLDSMMYLRDIIQVNIDALKEDLNR